MDQPTNSDSSEKVEFTDSDGDEDVDSGLMVAFSKVNPETFGFSVDGMSAADDSDDEMVTETATGSGETESAKPTTSETIETSADDSHNNQAVTLTEKVPSPLVNDDVCDNSKKSKHKSSKSRIIDDEDERISSTDENENSGKDAEEDDLTSKLKSIPVLPRIPKRKLAPTEEDAATSDPVTSYASVLERANVAPSLNSSLYPNWSTSGWKRSGSDKPITQWKSWNSRKSGGGGQQSGPRSDSKRPDRGSTSKERDVQNRNSSNISNRSSASDRHAATERSAAAAWDRAFGKVPAVEDPPKPTVPAPVSTAAAPPRLWSSPAVPEPTVCGALDEHAFSPETGPLPTSGPLPTLPFEEQMQMRARMRSQMLGAGVTDLSGSDSGTPAGLFQPSSSDNSPFNTANERFPPRTSAVSGTHTASTSSSSRIESSAHLRSEAPRPPSAIKNSRHDTGNSQRGISGRNSQPEVASSRRDSTKSQRSRHSDPKDLRPSSRPDQPPPPALLIESSKKKSSVSPPRPELPVLPLFAAVLFGEQAGGYQQTSAADQFATIAAQNSASWSLTTGQLSNGMTSRLKTRDESSRAVGENVSRHSDGGPPKSVTFDCPEGSEHSAKEMTTKESDSSSKKKLKYDDKLSLQFAVIEEMKNFLKPYYTRQQLSKEQYKNIMRHAVPRVCHGRPSEGDMAASRVHKYAKAYMEKALKGERLG